MTARDDQDRAHPRRWSILALLLLSLTLVGLDATVVQVALPTLANDLGATGAELQWIVDAYILAFGGLMLTMGALGDRFGRRGALQVGLAIVAMGGLAALAVEEARQLIPVRALMGVGAALVMPATLSIIVAVFPPEERGRAMTLWAGFAGLGAIIGLIAGGWLLEHFVWQSVFVLNVPVALVALVGSIVLVPTSRDDSGARLDVAGTMLSTVALVGLLYGIIEGPSDGWTSLPVVGSFVAGGIGLLAFVAWELRTKHPMLPMELFAKREFSTGNLVITLTFFGMLAMFFVMSQFFQFVLGLSPLETGLRFLPLMGGFVVGAGIGEVGAKRIGTRIVVASAVTAIAMALYSLAFIDASTPYVWLGLALGVLGVGIGAAAAPTTVLIMGVVPAEKLGVGSAMNDTSRELGSALGIGVLGSILNAGFGQALVVPPGLPPAVAEAARNSVGVALAVAERSGPAGAALAENARQAFVVSMGPAFLVGAIIAAIAAGLTFAYMPREAEASRQRLSRPMAEVVSTAGVEAAHDRTE